MKRRPQLFIRKRASGVQPGERVRCESLKGRWGWWRVESVTPTETTLYRRTGGTVRVSPNVTLLLPITADPYLC